MLDGHSRCTRVGHHPGDRKGVHDGRVAVLRGGELQKLKEPRVERINGRRAAVANANIDPGTTSLVLGRLKTRVLERFLRGGQSKLGGAVQAR